MLVEIIVESYPKWKPEDFVRQSLGHGTLDNSIHLMHNDMHENHINHPR